MHNCIRFYYQYTATVTPFLFIASIYGVAIIKKTLLHASSNKKYQLFMIQESTLNKLLITYIIFMSLYGAYSFGPLPGAQDANLDMITKQISNMDEIDQTLTQIPSTARVAASNNIASHLTKSRISLYFTPWN